MTMVRRLGGLAFVATVLACREPAAQPRPVNASANANANASANADASADANANADAKVVHPWPHAEGAERLDARFRKPPAGFTRVPVADGSLPAFLRALPLAPEGTKVVDYRGQPLYADGHHPGIAAVVDIDVGTRDLQQCADAVYRLHAEWRYTTSARKETSYRALSGTAIPYARYLAGERAVMQGKDLVLRPGAGAHADDHAFFRSYLDDVFAWASTASLERDGKKVKSLAEIQGGDAFVLPGSPFGHAVVVLDVAKDEAGRFALLLGQSYMPAQSVQVLRPEATSPWFVVAPTDETVTTPFWRPFPITSLRRLP